MPVKVEIGGNLVERVAFVSLGWDVASAQDMHPADARPRFHAITIARYSDKRSDLWKWALSPYEENFQDGKITFLHPEKKDTALKTVTWKAGWISSYTEDVPDIHESRDEPMKEFLYIYVRELDIDGVKVTPQQR